MGAWKASFEGAHTLDSLKSELVWGSNRVVLFTFARAFLGGHSYLLELLLLLMSLSRWRTWSLWGTEVLQLVPVELSSFFKITQHVLNLNSLFVFGWRLGVHLVVVSVQQRGRSLGTVRVHHLSVVVSLVVCRGLLLLLDSLGRVFVSRCLCVVS